MGNAKANGWVCTVCGYVCRAAAANASAQAPPGRAVTVDGGVAGVPAAEALRAGAPATCAGVNAAGGQLEFAGIPRSNMLKVLGVDLFSVGRIAPEDGSFDVVDGEVGGNYAYFLFRDSHLAGAILLGDTRYSAQVKRLVERREDCSTLIGSRGGVPAVLDHLARMA